jgi:peptidoglycan/xylan/chitin deacetylase (PgdA/CDA1 family)
LKPGENEILESEQMNRRQFTKLLGLSAVAIGTDQVRAAQKSAPQIAITMDDFNWQNAIYQSAIERNQAILNSLQAHSIKAALFVVGRNIERDDGKRLLTHWNKAGHLIGNHTYSHQNFNAPTVTLQQYEDDILRADTVLKDFSGFRKYFRFPMLKEGDTATKRDGVRSFLAKHGYRVGHVTIDTSDWVISARLTERLSREPTADPKPYRDFYLEHMWDRAQYYDSLARRVLGRSVKHTILVHYNLLNGLFMGELIQMFKEKGWQFIDAEEAFTDPVFSKKPNVLPAGESIVWALAKAEGTIAKSLKYPAEDGEVVVTQMKQLGL